LNLGNESAPFELAENEPLILRIFLDGNIVEVFANDRQALLRVNFSMSAARDRISLFSEDGDLTVETLNAWKMNSIYTKTAEK
jgi:beta-fructofuranosidase